MTPPAGLSTVSSRPKHRPGMPAGAGQFVAREITTAVQVLEYAIFQKLYPSQYLWNANFQYQNKKAEIHPAAKKMYPIMYPIKIHNRKFLYVSNT
jgi:hypothetical protein